jgi:uncharacterized protein (DUF1778 family)
MATKTRPNRSTDASLLLRCQADERELIERAVQKVQAGLPPGAKITMNGFVLAAALEKARALLGKG